MHIHEAPNTLGVAVARKIKAVNIEPELVELGDEFGVLVDVTGGVLAKAVLQQDVGLRVFCRPHKGCDIEV